MTIPPAASSVVFITMVLACPFVLWLSVVCMEVLEDSADRRG
jgi:hypothetical protein